jgi:hypothetical protein
MPNYPINVSEIPNEDKLNFKTCAKTKPQKVECKTFRFFSFKVSKLYQNLQNLISFVCTFKKKIKDSTTLAKNPKQKKIKKTNM